MEGHVDVVGFATVALALSAQGAAAQLGEKRVLTPAAAQKIVAAAQAEAERNRLAGIIPWSTMAFSCFCCCGLCGRAYSHQIMKLGSAAYEGFRPADRCVGE